MINDKRKTCSNCWYSVNGKCPGCRIYHGDYKSPDIKDENGNIIQYGLRIKGGINWKSL